MVTHLNDAERQIFHPITIPGRIGNTTLISHKIVEAHTTAVTEAEGASGRNNHMPIMTRTGTSMAAKVGNTDVQKKNAGIIHTAEETGR